MSFSAPALRYVVSTSYIMYAVCNLRNVGTYTGYTHTIGEEYFDSVVNVVID